MRREDQPGVAELWGAARAGAEQQPRREQRQCGPLPILAQDHAASQELALVHVDGAAAEVDVPLLLLAPRAGRVQDARGEPRARARLVEPESAMVLLDLRLVRDRHEVAPDELLWEHSPSQVPHDDAQGLQHGLHSFLSLVRVEERERDPC